MKKLIAVLMALLIAAGIFISCLFIGENLHHPCCGDNCKICMEIKQAEALISNTGLLLAALAAVISILFVSVYKPVQKQTMLINRSLISLKVELLA
jgi:hypothetical protein